MEHKRKRDRSTTEHIAGLKEKQWSIKGSVIGIQLNTLLDQKRNSGA